MRVAIVHDWLYVLGGAERVLADILKCYPDADVFTLFNALSDEDQKKIGIRNVRTSFLHRFPKIAKIHRFLLPLMPLAIEQFDFSEYDLVISSSYAVAKGVLTGPNQVHVAYVHSPMRYAWDLQHEYLRQSNMERGLKSALVRMLLGRIRIWDVRTAHGPDLMLANSAFVARRIRKIYGREAPVLNPPVEIAPFREKKPAGDYFFAASRLVPYKNIHLIVEAISRAPELKLVVAGTGPEEARLKAMAGPNVEFRGFVSDAEMRDLMAGARAFIFAAEEDFGIVPVEAQAEGTPVLAFGRGGALETVRGHGPRRTGLFFDEPTPDSILECVQRFIREEHLFDWRVCREHAERFSSGRFRASIEQHVAQTAADVAASYPNLPASLRRYAADRLGTPQKAAE
ncbi:MAG: glycosyltransferase [Beijerinckiaceae bacterium]|jgi:glycosyltransferase involved in cell wall biosynthesis|nr:glycosyltransferase [Beijerinckiaceae bacterium]